MYCLPACLPTCVFAMFYVPARLFLRHVLACLIFWHVYLLSSFGFHFYSHLRPGASRILCGRYDRQARTALEQRCVAQTWQRGEAFGVQTLIMSLWPNKELRTTTVACTVNQERSHQIIYCCSGRYVLCSGTFIFSGCFGLFHLLACLIGHVLSSGMFTYLRLRRVLCSGTFIPSACFAMFDFLACLPAFFFRLSFLFTFAARCFSYSLWSLRQAGLNCS